MHTRMPQEECSSTHGVRSILLSGAELARLKDLWSVQLFFAPDSSREQEEEVELRSKSGISVESAAVPFNWNRATATDYSSGGRLVLTQGVSSADSPIVVLKSRAVIQAEKERQPSTRWSSEQAKKKRAFSMDESSLLGRLGDPVGVSRNEIFGSARRPAVPLPLPLPPDKEFNHSHRRHLSIDLRASPAAKFLVQVMQWEAREEQLGSRVSMGSNSSHCYVPFKWEEAPGKPKSSGENGFTAGARKLRLPPRLQQLDHLGSASLSPTSTLDHVVDSSSSSPNAGCSSSSLDPNETRTRTRKVLRAILALHIWQLWTKKIPKESEKMPRESSVVNKNTANYNSSWSPSPRPFWLRSTKHDRTSRPDNWRKDWALQKIASGCNVVKRAVRMRWWSYTKVSGSKKKRKSGKIAYRPLLCSVDGDSTAFACSSSSAL